MAVASAALRPGCRALAVNPSAKVKSRQGARKLRPLLWTGPRVERWQETGEIPASVMVWTAPLRSVPRLADTGRAAVCAVRPRRLFRAAPLRALRAGWAEVDLDKRRIHIRQAQVDDELDSTKSEDSDRKIAISGHRRCCGRGARRSSTSGWRGAAPGPTPGACSPARTARRCGPVGRPGSRRSPERRACRRSASMTFGTARPRCC